MENHLYGCGLALCISLQLPLHQTSHYAVPKWQFPILYIFLFPKEEKANGLESFGIPPKNHSHHSHSLPFAL